MRALDDLMCAFLSSVRGYLSPSESSMSYQELGNPSPYLHVESGSCFFARTVSKELYEKLLHTRLVFVDPGPP